MDAILETIRKRRAVKLFEPVEIRDEVRDQILDAARLAPSSFNMQPYKVYWISTKKNRTAVARLCLGQSPAVTASALAVFVADIGSMKTTALSQAKWMRTEKFPEKKINEYKRTATIGRVLFAPGPLGLFGLLKRALLSCVNVWKTLGMPPLSRSEVLRWATKSTSLACQNFMLAAEALGLNTCPMEGFDGRRLCRHLRLSPQLHEIVMVIAVGKKSPANIESPQWRRPLSSTVTFL